MQEAMRIFAGLLSVTFSLAAQRSVTRPPKATAQITLNEVLSWLPSDTETVFGSNGPFRTLHAAPETLDKLTPDELRLLVINHSLTLLGLDEVGLGGLLASETVRLAVEGSRHFRSPTHLGLMLYEGCEIAVFTRDLNPQRDSFMKTARDSDTHIVQIEGATVAELKVGIEDDTWTVMVAFPMPRVVLVATNETYLREVLRRMRGATGPRALPASLPEWKYVRTSSPVWGLRHFDKTEQIDDDPSTPFREQRAANIPDNDAIGVAFYIEPLSRKLAHVAYLSGSRAREILSAVLGSVSSSPQDISVPSQAFTVAPGVIECTVPLETPHTAIDLLFLLSGLFGHAIYV